MRQPKIRIRKFQKSKISESIQKQQKPHWKFNDKMHTAHLRSPHTSYRVSFTFHKVNFFSIEYGHVHIECMFGSVIVNRDSRFGIWERVKCCDEEERKMNKINKNGKWHINTCNWSDHNKYISNVSIHFWDESRAVNRC